MNNDEDIECNKTRVQQKELSANEEIASTRMMSDLNEQLEEVNKMEARVNINTEIASLEESAYDGEQTKEDD